MGEGNSAMRDGNRKEMKILGWLVGLFLVLYCQNAVMKYFGPKASKLLSYSVASVSGAIVN
jgi:uncharacterized membrane protein YraQ (UPF0718 family)